MTTDPIAAARALIEPLTGYTPGPWDASGLTVYDTCMNGVASCHAGADARLIAASPDLRDTVAALADALEAERVKVAAARQAVREAAVQLAHALNDRQIDARVSERFEGLLDALDAAATALRSTETNHDD